MVGVVGAARMLGPGTVGGGERLTTLTYLVVHAGLPVVAGQLLLRGRRTLAAGGLLVALGGLAGVGAVDHIGQMWFAGRATPSVVLAAVGDLAIALAGCVALIAARRSPEVGLGRWADLRRDIPRITLLLGTGLVALGVPAWPWQPVGPEMTQALETSAWLIAPPGWTRIVVLLTVVVLGALALLAVEVRPTAPSLAITAIIAVSGAREMLDAVAIRRVWQEGMTVEPVVWMVLHAVGVSLVVVAGVLIWRRVPSVRSEPPGRRAAR